MDYQVFQNYHQDCEADVNKQINLELNSSCVYLSIIYFHSSYFDRDDVSLLHFAEFFRKRGHEGRGQAEQIVGFQNRRGGRILMADFKKAEQDKWSNALAAMWRDLHMEKDVNQCLLDLHKLATHHADPYLRDFLQNNYLDEKLKIIKKLEDQITNLKRLGAAGNGLGEYLFDRFSMD
ncbi:ferritin heavy chain B-like [Pristis pectinata]|uniref:ferritin heavy chain B-like n=1 Tax=Pristis pectinata TaxID=685728 RepID=UPI00223D6FFC|nr:ferritin heavy chain B-like [Pristis pectinata]